MRGRKLLARWAAGLAALMLAAAPPAVAMQLQLVPLDGGRAIISLRGPILDGDADHLAKLVAGVHASTTISGLLLDSPGGSLLEAARMVDTIKTAKWKAAVGSGAVCTSACFLLFAAASARIVAANAAIGVHSASERGEDTLIAKAATTDMARMAGLLGVPSAIVGRMVTRLPGEVAWLTPAELKTWGVTTLRDDPAMIAALAPGAKASPPVPAGQQASSQPAAKPATPASVPSQAKQAAVLFEEPLDPKVAAVSSVAFTGTVTWAFVESTYDGPEVVATVAIPDRRLTATITIRENRQQNLAASHIVELVVKTPFDFPGGRVEAVPTIVLKPDKDARGDVLAGASATVAPGYYWVALAKGQKEMDANLSLLREGKWMDVRLIYANDQRAILSLERGAAGDDAFARALAAWQRP